MSGLIIFPIFILYVVVGFLVLNFLFSLFKWNIKKYIIVIIVILLPFWDLFIQKGIKTYYQIFNLTEINIYAQPERDNEGRIESLNIIDFSNIDKKTLDEKQYKAKYISDFIELKMQTHQLYNKVKLNLNDYSYTLIDTSQARYILKKVDSKNGFLYLYKINETLFIDLKTNKLLANVIDIEFSNKFSYLREQILMLISGTGSSIFYISSIDNFLGFYRIKEEFKLH